MAKITFYAQRCKGCGLCVLVCPRDNIRISKELNDKGHTFAVLVDPAKCTHCAMCGRMCPDVAIEIEDPQGPGPGKDEPSQ
jgi:2-oxoglutarate ferredoxin oxidoreductase subunit delta